MDRRKVLRLVRAAACDVEQVINLLGAGMSADVTLAVVLAKAARFPAFPVSGHNSRAGVPRHFDPSRAAWVAQRVDFPMRIG
jgi:hypothetical protein